MSITIKNVTLSYPSLFKPTAFDGNMDQAKYSTDIIIKKGSEAESQIQAEYDTVAKKALEEKKLTKSQLTPFIRPIGSTKGILIDCDDDPDRYPPEIYRNCYILRPKSKAKPVVVDRRNAALSEDENAIYGGVIANVNVNFYAYNKIGTGIAVGLNGVQKVADGEPLGGGRPSVDQMFGEPEEDDMFS